MPHSRRVLIVDDQADLLRGIERLVADMGHQARTAESAEEALRQALEWTPDLVLTDLNLPGRSGLELIADLQEAGVEATVLVLTGHGSIDSAIEATRRGVYDYLQKPVEPQQLKDALRKGLERSDLRRELRHLRREMKRSGMMQELVGTSPAMLEIYNLIEQVADSDAPVLITGESGTGKEVVARTLHRLSSRSGHPMVAVNCAAIPENLLESELFGHKKGAFTGAVASRTGCFELAHEGSLLLDELGEMPLSLQSKLLRVLETRRVRRLGDDREVPVDVRVIAATNLDPERLTDPKHLRQDLYFRLNVVHLHLPPLRERPDDIPQLVERFSAGIAVAEGREPVVFSDDALELLSRHTWPGNAREVRNVVHRAIILCREGEVQPHHLPPSIRPRPRRRDNGGREVVVPLGTPLSEVERSLILATLESNEGNKTRTAAELGISTKTLYTKLKRYEDEA